MDNHVLIFDTTLRDGEQSPGASMTQQEKVQIATRLDHMKVDIIEAGFAIASQGDFASIQAVAKTVKNAQVASLARAKREDIERAAESIKDAVNPRIHTFLATSPIHMQMKLQLQPNQVLEQAVAAVKLARKFTDNVEFSPEDGGRSEIDFLCRIVEAVITAGATTINIPDTVGYTLPKEFGNIFKQVISRVPNSHKAIFSAHCHNDLGLAVANSLAAVDNGARQIECTINGLGERAGNTALEEVVMALKTRQDQLGYEVGLDVSHLVPLSRIVANITGFPVQPNKAIVGVNAFAHESGIHQDGVLKSRETYEIMRAEDVGWQSNKMVLGKHSGKAAVNERLCAMGYKVDAETLRDIMQRFKQLADRKHEIFDDDLHALMLDSHSSAFASQQRYQLEALEVISRSGHKPTANLQMKVDGCLQSFQAIGDGAVDAVFKAVNQGVTESLQLLLYSVNNVTDGTDSQGEVGVRLRVDGKVVNGTGVDTDILMASAKAYIDALNRVPQIGKKHPQLDRV